MMTFSSDTDIKFNLTTYSTKRQILNAISFTYTGGTTNTAKALEVRPVGLIVDTLRCIFSLNIAVCRMNVCRVNI